MYNVYNIYVISVRNIKSTDAQPHMRGCVKQAKAHATTDRAELCNYLLICSQLRKPSHCYRALQLLAKSRLTLCKASEPSCQKASVWSYKVCLTKPEAPCMFYLGVALLYPRTSRLSTFGVVTGSLGVTRNASTWVFAKFKSFD